MEFRVEEFLSKLPLPANEKWKEGVWDVELFCFDFSCYCLLTFSYVKIVNNYQYELFYELNISI